MEIEFDENLCMGYANCVMVAPSLFDMDPDTDKAVLLQKNPLESQRSVAEEAARVCPAAALKIVG